MENKTEQNKKKKDYFKKNTNELEDCRIVLSKNISIWEKLENKKDVLKRMYLFNKLFDFSSDNSMYFFSFSFHLKNVSEGILQNTIEVEKQIKKQRPDKNIWEHLKTILSFYDDLQRFKYYDISNVKNKTNKYFNFLDKIRKINEECKKINDNLEKNIVLFGFEMIKKSKADKFIFENDRIDLKKQIEKSKDQNEKEMLKISLDLFEKRLDIEKKELIYLIKVLSTFNFCNVEYLYSLVEKINDIGPLNKRYNNSCFAVLDSEKIGSNEQTTSEERVIERLRDAMKDIKIEEEEEKKEEMQDIRNIEISKFIKKSFA